MKYFNNFFESFIYDRSYLRLIVFFSQRCGLEDRALRTGEVLMQNPRRGAGLSANAGGWAKFERPKNACVFEGGRIWLSPHGRARRRAQLARAKPGGGPEVGRRSAYALVIRRPAP